MTRPWESAIGARPWEAAQSLFIRTITIKRPPTLPTVNTEPLYQTGEVAPAYQGTDAADETLIVPAIPANIEVAASGRNTASGGLPDDAPGPIKWTIVLPAFVMATMPLILDGDVIYDDLGNRYQVAAYQPSALGARIDTVRAEA